MSKYSKMLIGLLIIIGTWLVGFLVWMFFGTSVRMNNSIRDFATIFNGVAVLPSIIMYIIWYLRYVKLQSLVGKIPPKSGMYIVFSAILTIAVLFAPMIVLGYIKAVAFVAGIAALTIIGSFLSYKVGEPR